MEVSNVIGSGQIDPEVDLPALESDLSFNTCYITGPGLYFKFEESGPTVVVARSGKYFFTGASSLAEIEQTKDTFLKLLSELGIINTPQDNGFSIKNMVFTADLDRSLNLPHLSMSLGLESVEYEPEQFPGLIYRPDAHNCILLIFASGKVVITGATSQGEAETAFEELINMTS